MRIQPNNEKLIYSGRIDWNNPAEPVFVFSATSVSARFTGDTLKIYVKNQNAYWNNYLGYILDGEQSVIMLPKEGELETEITVKQNENNIHEVMFFKRQDSCHEVTFLGLEIGDGDQLLEMPKKSERRIEVYGTSVSAGEVSEAVAYVGKEDPKHNGEYSNSWYSYAWMTARKLNAEIHDIAQGGIALMDKTGWFYEPDAIGMETVWNKVHYNPEFGNMTEWNFDQYIPQVVIVSIGQNDSHPEDYMKENYSGDKSVKWRKRYGQFLMKLRNQYPDAWIVCCSTLLMHDESWDLAMEQVIGELEDEKITKYHFKRNGTGTLGHLRIPEAEEMAEELAAYIENLKIKGWENYERTRDI